MKSVCRLAQNGPGRRALPVRTGAVVTVLALLLGPASAAPARDPDWPCQQLRVGHLTIGALWNGPPLDAVVSTWQEDEAVAALAHRVAQRRMAATDAEQAVRDFARTAGRNQMLALAAGVFSILDGERSQVIAGLGRFGARQRELASAIRADMERLRAQPVDAPGGTQAQGVGQLSDQLGWETRVFEQRRQSLSTACDVPNLIERRLGVLLRAIAATVEAPATQ